MTDTADNELATDLREDIQSLRDQTRHADSKAQLLAAALIPSVVGAVAVGGYAGLPATAEITAGTAMGCALAAILALGAVVWPQHPGRAVLTGETKGAASAAGEASPASTRRHLLAVERARLERITAVKWALLRTAITGSGLALVLGTVTVAMAALG
ncbi:hypothetical protein [Glycomyces salinus]|uniref:hypothetical protein n=1 Tax=Glycomyces salinus TaxID=980294 RepID=UPI0018ED57D2|nr:hypothetical protein [Glycomyces salinus]